MKAAVLIALREIRLEERPLPRPGAGEVRIRPAAVGVCGSDVHYYTTGRIGTQVVRFPFVVGHECAGVVDAAGPGVRRLHPGDRVAVDPAMPCHACDQCRKGRPHTCRALRYLGCPGQSEGCLSECVVLPEESCFPLPEGLSLEQGALVEPFSIGLYAVRASAPGQGARIAILGSGPIGLSVLVASRARGAAAVYTTDRIETRVLAARRAGATWAGNPGREDVVQAILRKEPEGLDAVFECAGKQETLDQALALLAPGGRLMIVGIPEFDRFSFSAETARRQEIALQNVRRQNGCTQAAIDLLASGRVDLDFLVTHRFPLSETKRAFELAASYGDGVLKAMIELPA
ncbi:MAG: alcohol dehydrogenase catalytic domain-containing protein [Planctomycetota bacterium]